MLKINPRNISISDFDYSLPADRIALFPPEKRDSSKLLVYKNGEISAQQFSNLPSQLDASSLLIFNNSRVINARIKFQKPTGGMIEIFCLEPADAITGYHHSLSTHDASTWKCLVGGMGKWKTGSLIKSIKIDGINIELHAEIAAKTKDAWLIRFSWNNNHFNFLEILEKTGQVPLPPYLKREVEESDKERYQTIYSREEGSVAAPTAGLHFTSAILTELTKKGITLQELTLHVGAGTFKPVNTQTMEQHIMHAEWIEIDKALIKLLISTKGNIVTVGTTSLRTIESLYWIAAKILTQNEFHTSTGLGQWDIYDEELFERKESKQQMLEILLKWMNEKGMDKIYTQTRLLITPGYKFRIADALVTNFHQPQSTLLLLVAVATNNKWRELYDFAMAQQFRFLSYGDSSLIFFDKTVKAE